jgi:hypothetical protein
MQRIHAWIHVRLGNGLLAVARSYCFSFVLWPALQQIVMLPIWAGIQIVLDWIPNTPDKTC